MFPMYQVPSKFMVGHMACIFGKWLTIKSTKSWEGCTQLTFKENGDVYYLLDDRKYEYQIPGVL